MERGLRVPDFQLQLGPELIAAFLKEGHIAKRHTSNCHATMPTQHSPAKHLRMPHHAVQGLMLRKLGSPDALMDVSLCAYVIRMLCYAMLPALRSPWCVCFHRRKV